MSPGIQSVVQAHGTEMAAVEANVRAAVAMFRTPSPSLGAGVKSGRVLVVGAVYQLGSGKIGLLD